MNILERKCISLNTYSNILALRGDSFTESLQRINEAEKIARYLLGNNKLSGATLAITLENKGLKLKKISSVGITEIENCYKEALNLYSQLAKLFPNKYIGNLADMYEKIAMLISDDSQREIEVFDLFEKSLKQYKQCLVYSDDYFIDIARIHNNIGWPYYKTAKNYTDLLEAKKTFNGMLVYSTKFSSNGSASGRGFTQSAMQFIYCFSTVRNACRSDAVLY